MYYLVEKGSDSYKKLEDLMLRIKEVNKEASDFVRKLGFEKFSTRNWHIAGGIDAIQADEKPEGYKVVGKSWQRLFFPKANNKKLLKEISSLPIITHEEYNKVIGFKAQFKGVTHYRAYGLLKVKDGFLITIADECDYDPPSDLTEILPSRAKVLKEEVESVKEKI